MQLIETIPSGASDKRGLPCKSSLHMQSAARHSLGRRQVLHSSKGSSRGSSSRSLRCTIPRAQPDWAEACSLFAAGDRLNDAARRKQLKREGASNLDREAALAVQRLQLSQDALAAALQQMQAATVQEQYEEAARLWDESLAWLEGWHKSITAGSPASSLLHVGRQHGRWIAR